MFTIAWCSSSLIRAMSKSGTWFYAVKHGRVPGVYSTWAECESQVKGFSKPAFKKFSSFHDAQRFIADEGTSSNKATDMIHTDGVTKPPVFSLENSLRYTEAITSNQNRVSSNNVTLASLSLEVAEMQRTVNRLVSVMEGLSSDLSNIQDKVARLESTVFIAPGGKRHFSTLSNESDDRRNKRLKRERSSPAASSDSQFEEPDGVHVYTDGGCFDNGKKEARAGIGVYWGKNDPNNVSEPLLGRPSNNRAEIHAAVKAVQIAKRRGIKNLIIHTDSQFLINGITKWIKGWKKNGWKLSTGHPVINRDDFTALDNELCGISVKWVYVRGHSGDMSNEEADKLAKLGAEKAGLT